ncbi:hypothetical protein [Singulisphaera sp. PoT]|uniref:hypothetical protein n=1 Tax=Singulisphaera sp. PoT TaxID=3411797 RepID=UPI003BF549EA
MTSMIVSMTVAMAVSATSGHFQQSSIPRFLPDGPGYGWGFPNGNPDGYGWFDYSTWVPLGANRTSEYYFPRHFAMPVEQMFPPNYYNPYMTRGQRYVTYTNCGGDHPAGGPPLGSANTPVHPYNETLGTGSRVPFRPFTGRVEASPINSGASGLTP